MWSTKSGSASPIQRVAKSMNASSAGVREAEKTVPSVINR
jgi:hypothetical protein